MISLQVAIKWCHGGFRNNLLKVLSDKILIFILVKEMVWYTGKSPLEALLSCEILKLIL